LLRSTGLSMRVIASSCGFSCTRSFHRAFKRATGMTPHAYRNKGANGSPSR
jgi:transcriptional regulator GlxA family with amidase domain